MIKTMSPLAVVKHLDVVDYIATCIITSRVDVPLDPFTLEQLEETLSNGVIVTVSTSAHAGL